MVGAAALATTARAEIGTVSMIATGQPPALSGDPIEVGNRPLGIAITHDGTVAYVANNYSSTLSAIGVDPSDPATYNQVFATIEGMGFPEWVAIRSDDKLALVTDECLDRVLVVDIDRSSPTYHTILARVYVGINPEKLSLVGDLANGNLKAWVANEFGSVSVIDVQPGSPTENRVVAWLALDGYPEAVAVKATSDGLRVYVTQDGADSVTVFDGVTYSPVATIAVGSVPEGMAANPDPNQPFVYVTNAHGGSVSVIDCNQNAVVDTIFVGPGPQGVEFSPDGSLAYVANNGDTTVSVIDTASRSVIYTLDGFREPYGAASTPDGSAVYVTDATTNFMSYCNR
jgi:YVTN family beta-propeller protein